MNLPVIFSRILSFAKNAGGRTLLVAKAHAPEIFIGAGIVGFGCTIGATVHATNETRDILDERDAAIEHATKNLSYFTEHDPAAYNREDYEEDVKKAKSWARRKLIRTWLPVGTLGTGSVISVLGGYKIINGRYVATTAAYKFLESETRRYRNNVIARYGEDVDKELWALKSEELDQIRKEKEEAEKEAIRNPKKRKHPWQKAGQHMIFDDYSDRWQRYWTPAQVMDYLHTVNSQLADLLMIRGHLFLNEVNDRLGLGRTPNGQVIGWIYDKGTYPIGKKIDILGLGRIPESKIREILSITRNDEIAVPLYPEPDGIIFDLIGKHGDRVDLLPDNSIVEF